MDKVFNSRQGRSAKIQMRRNVLEYVTPASVFDAFCGPGELWCGAWREAAQYVGCDTSYDQGDERRRFVGDNRRVMRAIDLQRFNVFDFDAFGSPWEQMTILAARREWQPGEVGAVVITDGSSMKTRFGATSHALARMCGLDIAAGLPPTLNSAEALFDLGLARWMQKSRVKPFKIWRSESNGSGKGGQIMHYLAAVFRGNAS